METNPISILIPIRVLKAMTVFASDDPTRPILQTLAIDYLGEDPVVVATDGHVFGSYNLATYKEQLQELKGKVSLIPVSMLKRLKVLKKYADCGWVKFEDVVSTTTVTITYVDDQFKGSTEGTYPNWRQIIPSQEIKPVTSLFFNPAYAFKFYSFQSGVTTNGAALGFHFNGGDDYPMSVVIPGIPEFYGIIMPIRPADTDRVFKAPSFQLAEVAEVAK